MQHSYRYIKPLGQFWKFIQVEFENEVGKPIGDPLRKMNKIVKEREIVIAQQKKESEMVQEETNFTQAVDEWRKVLQTHADRKEARRVAQKEKKADRLLAALQEVKMMRTLKEKRSLPSESPMEVPSSEDDDVDSTTTSLSTPSDESKSQP